MDKKNTENKIIKSLFTFDGIKKTDKKSLIKIVSVFIIIFAIFSVNTTKLEAAIKLETTAYSNDDTIKVQASVLWGTPVTADKKIVEIIIKDINDNIISSATIPMTTKPGTDNNQGGTINMDKLTANTNYKVQVLATQGEGASGLMMPNIINIKTRPAGEKTLVLNGENPVVIINQDKSAPPPNGGVYTLLAPIGDITTAPDNMGDYFNTIFTLAIGLCGVLAVIMIVIGGVQYMGDESIFGKTEAKSRITSAVLGLLIALGSYALLNTINPDLLGKGGIKINSVSATIDPEVHGDTPQAATNGKYCNGKYTTGEAWPSDQTERAAVIAAGITVNASNCTKVGQAGCTSLAGLNTSGVIGLKSKCGGTSCELIITGGTECWLHSNKTQHLPGNSIVDLRPTNTLVSYVDESKTKIPSSGMPFPVFLKDTTKFMRESNPDHYHIINW